MSRITDLVDDLLAERSSCLSRIDQIDLAIRSLHAAEHALNTPSPLTPAVDTPDGRPVHIPKTTPTTPPPVRRTTTADQPNSVDGIVCDQCGGQYKSRLALSIHRAKTHGIPSSDPRRGAKTAAGRPATTPSSPAPGTDEEAPATATKGGAEHRGVASPLPTQRHLEAVPDVHTCPHPGCDRRFTHKRGLNRHLNETHGVKPGSELYTNVEAVPLENADGPASTNAAPTTLALRCEDCDWTTSPSGVRDLIRHTLIAHDRAEHRTERSPSLGSATTA